MVRMHLVLSVCGQILFFDWKLLQNLVVNVLLTTGFYNLFANIWKTISNRHNNHNHKVEVIQCIRENLASSACSRTIPNAKHWIAVAGNQMVVVLLCEVNEWRNQYKLVSSNDVSFANVKCFIKIWTMLFQYFCMVYSNCLHSEVSER